MSEDLIEITGQPISIPAIDSFLREGEGGAVNLFIGTTRRITADRITTSLTYEAAPELAAAEIKRLIKSARAEWQLLRVAVVHRTGFVPVGEASVVIGVATAHRAESFEACRFLIDELKKSVPIWKKESFEDGSQEWVHGHQPKELN